jgi:hypothetical protein
LDDTEDSVQHAGNVKYGDDITQGGLDRGRICTTLTYVITNIIYYIKYTLLKSAVSV